MSLEKSVITIFTALMMASLPGCHNESDVHDHSKAQPNHHHYEWLAGDHHVHSEYSVSWRHKSGRQFDPTLPVAAIGGDAMYSTAENVQKAQEYGLSWMVTTDHGGPNHSQLNHERAYPDLLKARERFPQMIVYYGMEFDTPGAEHSSLILPHTHDEAEILFSIESQFNKREPFPPHPDWDTEAKMDEALAHMRDIPHPPVLIANHPSRTKKDGKYTKLTPSELRRWNNIAPNVAVGMEGSPGHQARAINPDGSLALNAPRAGYTGEPTMGGFDQMTARLGGFWDSMLAEGRHWWITATSDAHRNWRDGGDDFWPGEYSKTYVLAERNHASILDGLRHGRVFVTTGDLINALNVTLSTPNNKKMGFGSTIDIAPDDSAILEIQLREPITPNPNGDSPKIDHVDIIMGEIHGELSDPDQDTHEGVRVLKRLKRGDFEINAGGWLEAKVELPDVYKDGYIRLRGTNTKQSEPDIDLKGENPWADLWFYSNPIFFRAIK